MGMSKTLQLLGVEGDQRAQVFATVADHHRLPNDVCVFDSGFDILWSDVLAASGDDNVLFATGDGQKPSGVPFPKIPRMKPAVDERLPSGLFILKVARKDVGPLHQDLPILAPLHLHPGQNRPHGAITGPPRNVKGGGTAAFGLTVDFVHDNIKPREKLQHLLGDGGRT